MTVETLWFCTPCNGWHVDSCPVDIAEDRAEHIARDEGR